MAMFWSDYMDLYVDATSVCGKYTDVRKCMSIGSCCTCVWNKNNRSDEE